MTVERIFDNARNNERGASYSHAGNFEILSPEIFFLDFNEHACTAKKRALAQTMYVEPGKAFETMINSLKQTKANGAEAVLQMDYYSFMVDEQQLSYIPSLRRSIHRSRRDQRSRRLDMIQRLEDAEVSVVITNPPTSLERIFPFKGRNHIKLAIVDDIAWVGGLSYRDADLKKEDFMMRIIDPKIVNALANVFPLVNERRPSEDLIIHVDNETTIIVDCGDARKSSIFDYALELVQRATSSVRFATQYAPNGVMVNAFSAKHNEGKNISAVVSTNAAIVEWYGRVIDKINTFSTRIKGKQFPLHLSHTRVHAKALLVDGDIPERAFGMVGSHNLTRSGVMLGTQELGFFSSNLTFVTNLRKYFEDLEMRASGEKKEGNIYES